MNDISTQISTVLGSAPIDLVELYETGHLPTFPDSRINVLPFEAALTYTNQMRGIPVVDRMGMWVLDNADDSNPYGLITKGPFQGYVVHFSHDPEPEIAFDSLRGFIAEARRVGEVGGDIDDFQKRIERRCDISDIAIDLVQEDIEDSIWLLALYMTGRPIVSPVAQKAVAAFGDFYAGEALANWLKAEGSAIDLPVAEELAANSHPQVSNPGKAAVAAIQRRSSQQGDSEGTPLRGAPDL